MRTVSCASVQQTHDARVRSPAPLRSNALFRAPVLGGARVWPRAGLRRELRRFPVHMLLGVRGTLRRRQYFAIPDKRAQVSRQLATCAQLERGRACTVKMPHHPQSCAVAGRAHARTHARTTNARTRTSQHTLSRSSACGRVGRPHSANLCDGRSHKAFIPADTWRGEPTLPTTGRGGGHRALGGAAPASSRAGPPRRPRPSRMTTDAERGSQIEDVTSSWVGDVLMPLICLKSKSTRLVPQRGAARSRAR